MSDEDLKFAVVALSAIFFVIDPLATMPIFLTITSGDTIEQRRRTALRGAIAAWFTLTTFAIAGGLIFQALGISLGAFKIAGGLMLLLMAIDMMRAQPSRTRSTVEEQVESQTRDDVAIFPLAIPMLAGPGAIATVMVLMSKAAWDFVDKILTHGNDLCLLLNASVNAYRRLDPHFEAPNQIKASAIDRGSMVRIPIGNENSARIEVRSIAPDSNPYLAIYALLRTGLEESESRANSGPTLTASQLTGVVQKNKMELQRCYEVET